MISMCQAIRPTHFFLTTTTLVALLTGCATPKGTRYTYVPGAPYRAGWMAGERVRVTHSDGQTIGTVRSVTTERLTVDADRLDAVIPIDDISDLDVYAGTRRNTGRGAWVGALTGAAAGAMIGGVEKDCEPGGFFLTDRSYCIEGWGGALVGGVALGLVGTGVGALLGTFVRTDKWERVPLENLHIRPDGVSLSLTYPRRELTRRAGVPRGGKR